MKKIFCLIAFLLITGNVLAIDDENLFEDNTIQARINRIGTEILNSNKIEKRVVFVYDKEGKKGVLGNTKTLTKRQVIIFGEDYKIALKKKAQETAKQMEEELYK